MTTKNIIRTIAFLLFVLYFDGCIGPGTASFGSRSKVLNPVALKNVSVVCLFPVIQRAADGAKITSDDSTNLQLWNGLNSRNLFTLVPMDSVNSAIRAQKTWDSTTTGTIARSLNAGAFIIARMNYSKESFGEAVADLSLQMVDSKTDSVIAYGLHNTFLGDSYFLPPGFETVKRDAIKGAVDALTDAIMKH